MQFDESYFLAEDRDGFHIRSIMKRYWAANIECLLELDRVCKKNNIKYFADYGTLLGAIRHKGYIPWDDDIDVSMLREDYEKFIKCAPRDLQYPFQLFNVKQTMWAPMRLINTPLTCLDSKFLEIFHYCPYTAGIDIYVLDKIPVTQGETDVFKKIHIITRYLSQYTDPECETFNRLRGVETPEITNAELLEVVNDLQKLTKVTLDVDAPLAPQLALLSHNIASSYVKSNSQNVAQVQSWAMDKTKSMNIHWFDKIDYVPFENVEIAIPHNYDEVLTARFSADYMTPRQKKASHGYPCFGRQEQKLFDTLNENGIKIPSMWTI